MEAERIDNLSLKSDNEIEWNFSEKFEKSMNQLINKNNHIRLSTRRKIRKGLLVAIIAIIVAFTGLMSVSACRPPFVEFIKKEFSKYNRITLSDESTPPVERMETEYTLNNLPEGYEIDTYQKDEFGVFVIWKDSNNSEIVFSQSLLDTNLTIDNEHGYKEIIINGYDAYLTYKEYNSLLIWTDGEYWFMLNVPSDLKDDIINMAENISEKN